MNMGMFSRAKPYRSSQINNLVHVGLFQLVAEGMKRAGSLCSAAFTTPTEGKWLFVQYCRNTPPTPQPPVDDKPAHLQVTMQGNYFTYRVAVPRSQYLLWLLSETF